MTGNTNIERRQAVRRVLATVVKPSLYAALAHPPMTCLPPAITTVIFICGAQWAAPL